MSEKQVHLIMPFTRYHLKETLINGYRPMNIILRPIMFLDEVDIFGEPWILPVVIPLASTDCKVMMPGCFKRNWFIRNCQIIDDDYYLTVDDDDFYEEGVFDAIKRMDQDIVIISMKRGYRIPENTIPIRQYPTSTLYAQSENVQIGEISAQQFFVKGKIFKMHLFNEESHNWDGEIAVHHKESEEQIRYEPNLYALFNYYEPGRWEQKKSSRISISNLNLAIGVPCSFPTVPLSFFYSFVHLERPDYIFIHADNGPIDTLRNDIVQTAQQAGATKLIMMDVDMIYHPKTITNLLARRLPIVGALCFRRYPPFDSIMLRGDVKGYLSVDEWEPDELVEVDATGAGCLMFDMEVFRKMPFPWFKFRKNPDNGAGIGEDIGFCQDLKAAGYRIFVDTSVPADHLATMAVNRNTNRLYRSMKEKQHQQALERALETKTIPQEGGKEECVQTEQQY